MSVIGDIGAGWTLEQALQKPLPDVSPVDRIVVRTVARLGRSHVARIDGLEHALADRDPFILVANHSTRLEAILLPAMLMLLREGRRVHFLADWNFQMIPGVGLLYRCAQVITVPNKEARPRFLNVFKPYLTSRTLPMDAARDRLAAGESVGIFPEGKVNRDRVNLLPGRLGAAALSLHMGVPVVAAGLRFPEAPAGGAIPEGSPMVIEFGPPLLPPVVPADRHGPAAVREWHATIMAAIGTRSHKISTSSRGEEHAGL